MVDLRTALAAVLGLGLGALCLAYPEAIIRVQTAGRRPHDSHGEYGTTSAPQSWRRLVQGVGVALVLAGVYFAVTLLS
jgi:hypothetical protein